MLNEWTSWTHLDAAGQLVHGTPGRANWGFGVTHTPIPPTPTPARTAPLTVVINEVAWAGTQSSSNDEWIELYNPSSQAVLLDGWTLKAADGSPNISLSGTIPAGGYFLLERTDEDTTDVTVRLDLFGLAFQHRRNTAPVRSKWLCCRYERMKMAAHGLRVSPPLTPACSAASLVLTAISSGLRMTQAKIQESRPKTPPEMRSKGLLEEATRKSMSPQRLPLEEEVLAPVAPVAPVARWLRWF